MSNYNVLLYQQGGTLCLDERLVAQPTAATISLVALDTRQLSNVDGSFEDITDAECVLDDLVLVLPAKQAPWKMVTPSETTGTVGDLTEEGRRFLLNRGGRKLWVKVSEFDTGPTDPPSDDVIVTEARFDEGIDFPLKAGDTLSGVRVSYVVDWSSVTANFTGQVKATWKVTVNGQIVTHVRIYDVVKQVLEQPATWSDVLALRPDADDQLSQVPNKEGLVTRAWQDVVRDLYNMGIRHNLIIPDGNTVLRDVTVLGCVRNLMLFQGLSIPDSYIGQGEKYMDTLESNRARFLGSLKIPIDNNNDGTLSTTEVRGEKRQVWFGRNRARDLGEDK